MESTLIAFRRRLGIALVIASALLGGCMSSPMRPVIAMDGEQIDMQDPVGNGRALLITGQYGLAIDSLTETVQEDPGNAAAYALLAVAYDHLKRYDLADRYHTEALRIDPNSIVALNNWGYSFLMRGDRARARGLLERAIAVDGSRPIVAANLALANGERSSPASVVQSTPAQPAVTEQSVRISDHVVLVRRVGRLVRLAPGVQMLVTESPPETLSALPREVVSAEPASDPRFALFRQLFTLMEDTQLSASGGTRGSPFASVYAVDDFFTL